MATVLESHLALLERAAGVPADAALTERVGGVEDLIALHTAVFEAMERRLGQDGLNEGHRALVPLFRRWLEAARRFAAAGAELRRQGHAVAGLDELLRAMNRAKPVAEDFDQVLALNQRIVRGEAAAYRPLPEVADELRSQR